MRACGRTGAALYAGSKRPRRAQRQPDNGKATRVPAVSVRPSVPSPVPAQSSAGLSQLCPDCTSDTLESDLPARLTLLLP